MAMSYEINWKKYIDPEFDSVIRTFLFYVHGVIKDTDSGYFAVKDEILKIIMKSQSWQASYDGNELSRLVQEVTGVEGGPIFDVSTLNQNIKKGEKPNLTESFTKLLALADGLSETSRIYYQSKICLFADGTYQKKIQLLHGKEKEKAILKYLKAFVNITISLSARAIYKDKLNPDDESIDDSLFKNPKALNVFMCVLFSLYSQSVYRKSIHELLQKNTDPSLLKAVTIDKSLVCTELFRKRIVQAQLASQAKFLEKLGRAIADKPLRIIKPDFETFIVLKMFWLSGLDNLSHEDLYYFLKSCGIKTPPEIPYAMEQFLKRHVHPEYRNWFSKHLLKKRTHPDKI